MKTSELLERIEKLEERVKLLEANEHFATFKPTTAQCCRFGYHLMWVEDTTGGHYVWVSNR